MEARGKVSLAALTFAEAVASVSVFEDEPGHVQRGTPGILKAEALNSSFVESRLGFPGCETRAERRLRKVDV